MLNFLRRDPRRARRDADAEREFLEGIVEGIWLPNWADAVEEEGGRTPRNITRETADEAPNSAYEKAAEFAQELRERNKATLSDIRDRASQADGRTADARELGYYLAMQAQGHGVSWFDDHEAFDVTVPYAEWHVMRGRRNRWLVEGSTSRSGFKPARDRSRRSARARRTRTPARRRGY